MCFLRRNKERDYLSWGAQPAMSTWKAVHLDVDGFFVVVSRIVLADKSLERSNAMRMTMSGRKLSVMMTIATTGLMTTCALGASSNAVSTAAVPSAGLSWPGENIDTWNGFRRHVFKVDGCECWVVEPKQAAPGNPWTWCMEFPGAFTARTGVPKLLEKGFHHVHINVGNTFGSPAALKHFDAFYRVIAEKGLAQKGALIGISRGGLYAYNWAALNPDKVACIYGDAPVCDFKSWPAGKGKGAGSKGDWAGVIKSYEFKDEAEALAYKLNPVDNLAALAKAKIPLIHVVGDADTTVPVEENTTIVERRYKELGGEMVVIHKPGVGHHPHGLDDPQPLVEFILKHTGTP